MQVSFHHPYAWELLLILTLVIPINFIKMNIRVLLPSASIEVFLWGSLSGVNSVFMTPQDGGRGLVLNYYLLCPCQRVGEVKGSVSKPIKTPHPNTSTYLLPCFSFAVFWKTDHFFSLSFLGWLSVTNFHEHHGNFKAWPFEAISRDFRWLLSL